MNEEQRIPRTCPPVDGPPPPPVSEQATEQASEPPADRPANHDASQPVGDDGQATPPADVPPDAPPPASMPTGTPSRGGPPRGNVNALTHGLRSHRMVLGTLGRRKRPGETPEQATERRGLAKVDSQAGQFRATLEQAVVETHASISLTHACLIATAARWERHAMLALRWLREQHTELSAADRLSFSRAIADASERRDKAIAALGIDRPRKFDPASIYDLPPLPLPPMPPVDSPEARQREITPAVDAPDGQHANIASTGTPDAL